MLPEALHFIRSLLCTATNTTPHERFLNFQCRSALGASIPTWLWYPDRILVKRHNRASKYEPLVNKAELIHATLNYAQVHLSNGRESTVSLRVVAPVARGFDATELDGAVRDTPPAGQEKVDNCDRENGEPNEVQTPAENSGVDEMERPAVEASELSEEPVIRGSSRIWRPPKRLSYYH